MKISIPQGPFNNPKVDDGIYEAIIDRITHGTYGNDDTNIYIKIVLRLPDLDQYFVTNLYFPGGQPSQQTEKRLWHFCSFVELEKQDVLDHPNLFKEKKLRVKILRMQRKTTNNGDAYYDVERFLATEVKEQPAPTPETDQKPREQKPQRRVIQYKVFA